MSLHVRLRHLLLYDLPQLEYMLSTYRCTCTHPHSQQVATLSSDNNFIVRAAICGACDAGFIAQHGYVPCHSGIAMCLKCTRRQCLSAEASGQTGLLC